MTKILSALHSTPSLAINGHPVRQVSQTESLGMKIDKNLSWNAHINDLIKKIAFGIGALKRVRPFYNVEADLQRSSSAPFQLLLFCLG
jgi:hypothetical protein